MLLCAFSAIFRGLVSRGNAWCWLLLAALGILGCVAVCAVKAEYVVLDLMDCCNKCQELVVAAEFLLACSSR